MKTKQCIVLLVALTATLFYSCGKNMPDAERTAELEARKEAFLKVYAMFESGSYDGIENYANENVIEHAMMPGVTATGIEGLKQAITLNYQAFPDTRMTMLSIAHEGDLTYVHYRWTGTNTGAMGEMPATGKAIDINGVDIIRFEGTKAAEHWGYMEEGKMMEQLGMMPPPEDAGDTM